jgi:hypothetical protein
LWDLSQVDPSDLSILFAGEGRLRIGFSEIDPADGGEPSDQLVEHAARRCCDNPYYAFHKPAGTSLICIQGDWSNLVDAKIKGRLAAAMGVEGTSPYSPLYARAMGTPKPWGVTALFSEYTGKHQPLDVDWSLERGVRTIINLHRTEDDAFDSPVDAPISQDELVEVAEMAQVAAPAIAAVQAPVAAPVIAAMQTPPVAVKPVSPPIPRSEKPLPRNGHAFATFWEFAVAVNRSDPAALALAGHGATSDIPIDGHELRRLLGMMWFRTVVLARLSHEWRDRILTVLIDSATVPDHVMKLGRQAMRLSELSYEQLQDIDSKTIVADWIRPDLDLLLTVAKFWGADTLKRVRFVDAPERHEPSMMETILDKLRSV